jgi:hypothetical protein
MRLILIAGWTSPETTTATEIYIGSDGEKAMDSARKAQNSGKFTAGRIKRYNLDSGGGVPLPVVPDVVEEKPAGNEKSVKTTKAN